MLLSEKSRTRTASSNSRIVGSVDYSSARDVGSGVTTLSPNASLAWPLSRSIGHERPGRGVCSCREAYLTRETRSPAGALDSEATIVLLHLAVSES